MKKIVAYGVILIMLLMLIIASSPRLMKSIYRFLPDPSSNGDLYMLSDLKQFKQNKNYPAPIYTHPKNNDINLYILGDSYTEFMPLNYFNVNYYKFIAWEYPPRIIAPLDTQKKDILIMEITERHLREQFQSPANDNIVIKSGYDPSKDKTLRQHLFNIKAEKNLGHILTYNNFACFFKELKAWIDFNIFNRIDEKVSLSQNKQFIFLKETTDSTQLTSSFYPLNDRQIDTIVQNINTTYHHFRSSGFTQVYLAIIPNPVSLIDPQKGNYNHLVERIETSQKLEMPVIDIYQAFKASPSTYYYKSDTHWNAYGWTTWLQKVDSVLHSISVK